MELWQEDASQARLRILSAYHWQLTQIIKFPSLILMVQQKITEFAVRRLVYDFYILFHLVVHLLLRRQKQFMRVIITAIQ